MVPSRVKFLSAWISISMSIAVFTARTIAQDSKSSDPNFGRDVAPVLVAQCLECHDANRKSGGLSMATFESLREGGESGAVWADSKSGESLIVRKLRGLDPPRMPRNRPPLGQDSIDRIAAWIDAGAKLEDGRKSGESVESLAWPASRIMAERLGKMNPAERLAAAENEVRRMFAAVRPETLAADSKTVRSSQRFVVIGVEDPKLADSLSKSIEAVADDSKALFGDRIRSFENEGLRFLVFVFERPAEFAEFCRQNGFESPVAGQNVVGRSGASWPLLAVLASKAAIKVAEPGKSTGSERRAGKSARRAVSNDSKSTDPRSVHSLAAEALVEAIFDEMPNAPAWLKTGLSLSIAQEYDVRSPEFEFLSTEARATGPARVTGDWPRRAEEFLKDRLSATVSRPFAFALIDWLKRTWPADFPEFVRIVSAGEPQLDNALRKLWNTDRATFIASWTESLMRGSSRKGRR